MKGMSTRERFLRSMHFKPVDRPPNFDEGYWGQTIDRWLKEGMPEEALKPPHVSELGAFYGHRYFGIDERRFLPLNFGPMPPFERKTVEETDRYMLFWDEGGRLRRMLKAGMARGTTLSMDTYIDFPIKDEKDFEEMKKRFDPNTPGRFPPNWHELVKRYNDENDRHNYALCAVADGAIGLYSELREWMGTAGSLKAFYSKPNMVHKMLDFITDFIIEILRKALQSIKVDYFNFFEDFAYKGGPHFSPHVFKEFLLPQYQRITDFLRKHRVDIIWLDTDGNLEPLISLLIEAGITCIWPLEAAAGMDPRKVRRKYGHDICLDGGIDKREIAKGKEAIEREIMTKVPEVVADGGYIPELDHTFPPDISYENFLYYLEVKKKALEKHS